MKKAGGVSDLYISRKEDIRRGDLLIPPAQTLRPPLLVTDEGAEGAGLRRLRAREREDMP